MFTQGKQEAIKQAEDLEQRLSSSVRTQAELEDQLNESRGHLGQMELVQGKKLKYLIMTQQPILPE